MFQLNFPCVCNNEYQIANKVKAKVNITVCNNGYHKFQHSSGHIKYKLQTLRIRLNISANKVNRNKIRIPRIQKNKENFV